MKANEFKKNLDLLTPVLIDDIIKKIEHYEHLITEYKRKLKLARAKQCPDPAAHEATIVRQARQDDKFDMAAANRRADKLFKIGLAVGLLLVLGLVAIYCFAIIEEENGGYRPRSDMIPKVQIWSKDQERPAELKPVVDKFLSDPPKKEKRWY